MRKLALTCGLLAMLVSVTTARAEVGIDTGFSSGLYGNYVFRGLRMGPVSLISDAYASYEVFKGLTVEGQVWGDLQVDLAKQLMESRYTGKVTYDLPWWDWVSVSAGYTFYDRRIPLGSGVLGVDTQEGFVGFNIDAWNLSPSVYAYYDFDGGLAPGAPIPGPGVAVPGVQLPGSGAVGIYVQGAIGRSFTLGRSGWVADVNGSVGLDFGRGIDTFNDAMIHTGLRWQLEKGLEFGPSIDWWFPSHQVDPGASSFRPVASVQVMYNRSY